MNVTTESSSSTNETTTTIQSTVDHNKTLVIILTIAVPLLACFVLFVLLIICYRRRLTKLWLKKYENTSRLQSFDSHLSSNPVHPSYLQKKRRLSYRQHLQPRTETIVYNQLSSPSTPVIKNSFDSPSKGEINAAFDEYVIQNEQRPILKQNPTTIQKTFPTSVQTPVSTITTAFVEAIAVHRASLLTAGNHTSLERLTPEKIIHNSQQSLTTLPTVLLFSQRTQF
ncbi:unnamed protein product [Adineta steineri]|uniref:Uncharacterized protein n=1 Tax=Adineta steineri TaxID=433720 RepID=A0A819N833_9BILA|nr:unnamed protein product [Adineta steineri]CAF3993031.1 unnamed protein product [Adineta steineri]